MRQAIDVHGSKERYEHALQWLKTDKNLSPANRKAILRFIWIYKRKELDSHD